MTRFFYALILIITTSLLLPTFAAYAEKLSVHVSILPQHYFLSQIGGNHVDIQVMVKPGANPATYEPAPRQMATLAKSTAYFSIGVPFETTWLPKFSSTNPSMRIIHTDKGIEKHLMESHHHDQTDSKKNHHSMNHDDHRIPDPHIWLSPPLVKRQAKTIVNALKMLDPENSSDYDKNFIAFITSADQLDTQLKTTFSTIKNRKFMVFHPSWGYFARTYGLIQMPIELEGKEPKPSQLTEIIKDALNHNIKIIFAQPQFSSRSAQLIANEIKGRVVYVDPLAQDWRNNLGTVAEQFKTALEQ